VPTEKAAYLRAYPWLGYIGHWGEQHSGFYNGPTGPNTKLQWTQPITWANESFRDTSFVVPAGGAVGSTATGFFCGAVATGSSVLTAITGNPSPVLIGLAVLAVLLLWLASRTTWEATAPVPVRRRRDWGTIVATSARLYASHLRLVLTLGLVFVPVGLLITGAQYLLFRVSGLSSLVDTAGASNAVVGGLAFLLGTLFVVFGLGIIQAACAVSIASLGEEHEVGAREAYRLVLRRWRPLVGAFVVAIVVITVLAGSTIGAIIAIWLLVRWSFLAQVIALEGASARGAFWRSSELVRGDWWRLLRPGGREGTGSATARRGSGAEHGLRAHLVQASQEYASCARCSGPSKSGSHGVITVDLTGSSRIPRTAASALGPSSRKTTSLSERKIVPRSNASSGASALASSVTSCSARSRAPSRRRATSMTLSTLVA
jgi:hypothetical protein